jgi:flavin-dependent dehydrogenase
VFETEHEDVNYLVMDNSFAPNGYAFLFVADGHATITLATLGRFDRIDVFFKKTKNFFAGRFGIKINNEIERTYFANFFIPQTAMKGQSLKVGEAAGFQDYMLGFGMKFAITSSLLAARAIAHGENYDMLWKKELLPKLELSLCNRFIYESAGDFGFNFFTAAAEQHDFREYMSLWHRQSLVKRRSCQLQNLLKQAKSDNIMLINKLFVNYAWAVRGLVK